jgi:hypothetical protein
MMGVNSGAGTMYPFKADLVYIGVRVKGQTTRWPKEKGQKDKQ